MKAIEQHSVDKAFRLRAARDVTIVRRSDREWYFTFVADDPVTQKPVKYALLTQRGKLRTWADPRHLFAFLRERGVTYGNFKLDEEAEHEDQESSGND
ncbi:KorA protein [Salmonella enterica]|nr:KorA protein [Salmonella enterica]EBR1292745.1 KorA protein [Salmonella enterica]